MSSINRPHTLTETSGYIQRTVIKTWSQPGNKVYLVLAGNRLEYELHSPRGKIIKGPIDIPRGTSINDAINRLIDLEPQVNADNTVHFLKERPAPKEEEKSSLAAAGGGERPSAEGQQEESCAIA